MAGMRKFLGGVVSGGLVAGVTLVVASQLSVPQVPDEAPVPVEESLTVAPETSAPATPEPVAIVEPEAIIAPAQKAPVVPEVAVAAEEADTSAIATAEVVGEAAAIAEVPNAEVTINGGVVAAAPTVPEGQGAVAAAAPVVEAEPEPEVAALPDVPPAPPQVDLPAQTLPESGDAAPTPAAEEAGSLRAQLPVPPAAPVADGAPEVTDLPPPPPLTEEEIAILADPTQLTLPVDETADPAPATEGSAIADAPAVQLPEPALPEVAVAEAAGDGTQSPVIPAPEPEPVVAAVEAPPAPVPEALPEALPAAEDATVRNPVLPEAGLAEDGPSTLSPTPGLINEGEGSLIDRAAAEDPGAEPAGQNAAALPEVTLADAPALERFATAFANPDAKPLFGILLVDTGEASLDRQAVATLPFPVSIVIDPLSPEAAAHAALYRAGGKEVVMLATGIPEGATPADVEQTFQAHASTLPEAVAVVDSSVSAFQDDRPLSTQIVPILAAQGRGLLTWDRGLNAADQVARREGLPTAMIFRQIDAEGESVPVMRRYLDRAAFRAAQEGEAIVIGTMRSETIAALLEWAIEGRASTVALAPASALLTKQ